MSRRRTDTRIQGSRERLGCRWIPLAVVLLLVVGGVFLRPFDSMQIGAGARLDAPTLTHFFGTDHMGRDVLSRVLDGASTTLLIALGTVLIGAIGGLLVGAIAGYFGGVLDEIVMRITDALTAFPSVLLALVVISLTGSGTGRIVVILGVLFIPSFARVARGEFLRCRNLDYISRARLTGASSLRIMLRHILPNTLPVYMGAVAIGFNNAVLAEASMSFLGLGVQPPAISLGRMLNESQGYLFTAPWMAIAPGVTIVLLVFAFSLLADGLQGRRGGGA